jgi:peptide/nickel transport system substrate-binding protein/oligopeptide transport system substrate-binding protein
MLHEGLVTCDREGHVVPGLARSWRLSEDRKTWIFELDPTAKTSDGTPLAAEDVVASFQRLLDPRTASPRAWVLERVVGAESFRRGEAKGVEGLSIPREGEVAITLEAPQASFLGMLTMPNAAVLPRASGGLSAPTSGPWVLVEHVRDSHLFFRRNPHWHGAPPEFEEVRVRFLPDEFTRIAEFEVGRLDVLEVPASASARFREHPVFSKRLHREVAFVTEYLGLNNEDPVLRDARVRVALNHAIDVGLILEKVLGGRGVRSAGAIPPSLRGARPPAPYDHDPEEAGRLLAEARVPADWQLELWQRPSPLASQVLEAIQADLKRVGIASEIRIRDWSALKASIDRGDSQAFYINWYADYPDPENFLVPLYHSRNIGGGGNRARFSDAEIDRELERLDLAADPVERAEFAAAIDARVHARAPWVYLWHPIHEVCVSDRVEGYRVHPIPSCERWLEVSPRAASSPAGS